MDDGPDLSRRQVLQASALGITGVTRGGQFQLDNPENPQQAYAFDAAEVLTGAATERPAPGSEFFENKTRYAYIYEDESGNRSLLRDGESSWEALNATQQTVVTSVEDLPAPTNGTHTLEANTAYVFNGFIASQYGLELGASTPLIGRHGSVDGFICTGGGPAITGTDAGFFARDLYIHAPAGTLFDISGTVDTEILVESCAFSDAAGIAPISNLGTVDGFRVPSFKGCNFEDFTSGLTFDGSPDKIFIRGCPFRNITTTGVTMLTFAGSLDVDIVDMPNNYIKGVQSDTEVVRVETGGSPNDIFQYRGTTHDSTVTPTNILNGEAATTAVGYRVADSYPLAESALTGDLDLTATTTVTGSGSAPAQIVGTTTLNNPERSTSPSNGVIEYTGKTARKTVVHANVSVSGANTEVSLYIGLNGSPIPRSEVKGFLPNNSSPVGIVSLAEIKVDTGDTLSAYLENTGGTKDLTAETMAVTV
ncbi:MAG: hypothetical protein ACNS61_03430 [Candidatus Wenzhouxiangella sp. M2_3B_020]